MVVLLAEDDMKIAKNLVYLLGKDGFQVDHATDGAEAMLFIERNDYPIIILDWMMPELSGVEVCHQLRNNQYQGGIIMLTAKDTLDDKIEGLDAGADDYLVKPFEYKELLARVKALARRSNNRVVSEIIQIGEFQIHTKIKTIFYRNQQINLTNKEYQLFALLLENNRQIVPRELLIDRVWGVDQDISANNLEAFIRLLRKKVESVTQTKIIHNVRGIGYKLEL